MMLKAFVASTAIVLGLGAAAHADDLPGPGWITMDQALHTLHENGYRDVVKVEADEGYWKAKVLKNGETLKVRLDPRSGAVLSSRRDHDDQD